MSNQNEAPPTVLDDPPFHLARLMIAFARLSSVTLREEGLSPQAAGVGSVLHALFEAEELPAKVLAQRTHLPKGTLTGVLERLEKAGWIKRLVDPEDGRAWRVRLTARGRALQPRMERRHARVMAVFHQALGVRDTQKLCRLLDQVTSAMRASTLDTSPTPTQARSR
jgi:DNA-binding MarR family transcriptional regulator